jgi:hypothetical protein
MPYHRKVTRAHLEDWGDHWCWSCFNSKVDAASSQNYTAKWAARRTLKQVMGQLGIRCEIVTVKAGAARVHQTELTGVTG